MNVQQIRDLPGVVGVFRGQKKKNGTWVSGTVGLCAHVRWKRDIEHLRDVERLPADVDVIEVGMPQADEVENTDPVEGTRERRSTLTLLATYQGYVFALVSGHGALPFVNGQLALSLSEENGDSVTVRDGHAANDAQVLRGATGGGGGLDWALIRFAPGVEASPIHSLGVRSPVELRKAPLTTDTVLRHYSSLNDRRTVIGQVKQVAESVADMQLPGGAVTTYSGLIVVSDNQFVRFSEPGDSGSMVLDEFNRAVGAIVGSSRQAGHAYIYPFTNLVPQLGEVKNAFFST